MPTLAAAPATGPSARLLLLAGLGLSLLVCCSAGFLATLARAR